MVVLAGREKTDVDGL
jgi:hypothetical protein